MESLSSNILVVDDDADIREVLADRLESLGYRVSAAETARAGLELLERQNPQLVLLDIEMPDMNGIDMLREIRRRDERGGLRLYTETVRTGSCCSDRGQSARARDFEARD